MKKCDLNRDKFLIFMDSDSIIDCLDTESVERLNYKCMTPVKDSYEKKVNNYIKSISTNFNTINKTKKKYFRFVQWMTFQQISLKNGPPVKLQSIYIVYMFSYKTRAEWINYCMLKMLVLTSLLMI